MVLICSFFYFFVEQWTSHIGGGKLRTLELPSNLTCVKMGHVRGYAHDPRMEIDGSEIEIFYSIDQGFFGSVYLIKYNGQLAALKCSKETTSTMTEEIDLMLQIGNHENIIRLHGICYQLNKLQDVAGPPPYPVLEYAECGNLRTFLRFQRNIGTSTVLYLQRC